MHTLQPKHSKISEAEAEKLLSDLNISKNQLPKINAEDPDGDALTYSLIRGPDGMEIDRSGSLSWVTEETADSLYLIEIHVLDGFGGSAIQEFELQVKRGSAF